MRQALRPGALGKPRGSGWRVRWEGGSGWGTHVNPWLFHSNVWQNSLQIKKKRKEKKGIQAAPHQKNKWPNQKNGRKNWRDFSPKKTYKWLPNTWKDAQHHSLSEKCTSYAQWGVISRWSGWLPSGSLPTVNAAEAAEEGNPLPLLVGMQTRMATMESSVGIPSKTGNRIAIQPRNPTAGHTHWGNQHWKRHGYPNAHRSTAYNS